MTNGTLQPLSSNFKIVGPDGFPTEYFIRWAQQRQIEIGAGITAEQAQALIDEWAASREIIAGTHLTGGGPLSADVTIDWAADLGDLSDVDLVTTPPTDGQVLKYDAASNTWIPGTGGGGGGGSGTVLATGRFDCTTPTAPTLVAGTNVASITRVATGTYDIVFSAPLTAAQVLHLGYQSGGKWQPAGGNQDIVTLGIDRNTPPTTTQIRVVAHTVSAGGASLIFDVDDWFFFTVYDASAAGSGSGGGSVQDLIWLARAAGYTTTYGNGSVVDTMVQSGDLIGFVFHAYTQVGSGSPVVSVNAKYTVPTGKALVILEAKYNSNCFTFPTFYHHEIYNTSTSTSVFSNGIGSALAANGMVTPDGANSTVTFPFQIAQAGETVECRAWSAGDGNYRTIDGEYVLALVTP